MSTRNGVHSPDEVATADFSWRVSTKTKKWKVSWSIKLTNNSKDPTAVRVQVLFLDKDGFALEDHTGAPNRALSPGETRLHKATVMMSPDLAKRIQRAMATVSVVTERHRKPGGVTNKCKLLFLAANPSGTTRLALDEESREIDQKIRASEHRDAFEQVTKWAIRPDDLLQLLNEHRPDVVHFSGHGSPTEEIVLLDAKRQPKSVSKQALRQLFSTLKDNVRVVVLNACFSRPQAEAITEVIDCAIGMKRAIGDSAAITFAAAFYRAVGFDRSVQQAFEQGKVALMLEGIPEETTPELLVKQGVDANAVYLLKRPEVA